MLWPRAIVALEMLSMAVEIVSPVAKAEPARAIKGRRLRRILSENLSQRGIDWSIENARSAKMKLFVFQEFPRLNILTFLTAIHMKNLLRKCCAFRKAEVTSCNPNQCPRIYPQSGTLPRATIMNPSPHGEIDRRVLVPLL